MRKVDAVTKLAFRIESMVLNSMCFKMNRKSKDETERKNAIDMWHREMKDLHMCLVDVVEQNEEQAEAIKEKIKNAKSYFAD